MTDPYRESARVPGCPVCGAPWDDSELAALACSNGCGVWMTLAYLTSIIDVEALALEVSPHAAFYGQFDDRPLGCPTCGETMAILWAHETPVRQCDARHGLWIAANDRDAFSNELYEPIEQRQRSATLRQLLAAVVAGVPGAVEQLADRILTLEYRIAELEHRRS